MTLIQSIGGSLNLNLHFHTLYLEGYYRLGGLGKPEIFISVSPPSKEEIKKVLKKIIARLIKAHVNKGVLVNERDKLQGSSEVLDDDPFMLAQARSMSFRFAFGPSKRQKWPWC